VIPEPTTDEHGRRTKLLRDELEAGNRGWGCSRWREGCAFVIWFQVAGRRITDAELGDLVSKGKTRKREWRAEGGAEISGASFWI
jgi:hypothetical protein